LQRKLNGGRGWIFGRNWDRKILRLSLNAIYSHLHQLIARQCTPSYDFLGLEISIALETIDRNASKGGKPNRKPFHPNGFRNLKFVHE
jgi:hypothetical protein